jgi:Uma2 family endonuclease
MSTLPLSEIPRKIWTREEAHALVDLGFPNAEKLELIEGELIDRMGKKHLHNLWQTLILEWLHQQFGPEFVQMESSIYVSPDDNLLSEPEPDLIVTAHSIRDYRDNVTPSEIRLIIEVSDSSVSLDLGKKAGLYARAAIPEYWVVDIPDRLVHVHRDPAQDHYTSIVKYAFAHDIAPIAKPDAVFCPDRL